MSCTEIGKWLNDYVDGDGELSEETRRVVKEHSRTCLSCHRELTELRSLLERAGRLPTEIEPEKALWPGIVSRITTPLPEIAEDSRDSARRSLQRYPLAVAAVLLLAIAVPFTLWQLDRGLVQSSPAVQAEAIGGSTERIALLARAEDGVLLPRTDLLESLERQRDTLSPETLATIEENALLIDQAIAQIRTALTESPGDRQLELLLAARYQQEVALLKRVNRV